MVLACIALYFRLHCTPKYLFMAALLILKKHLLPKRKVSLVVLQRSFFQFDTSEKLT